MPGFGIFGLLLALATFLVSYKGFQDEAYFERYVFRVDDILHGRQYYRLFTSGLLHTSWLHLLFNLATFYCFGSAVEQEVGYGNFALLYLASLVGGNLFSLWVHRHHGDYSAVGASGAISGLVFAAIALSPGIEVGWPGLYVPGWAYGLLYVLLSAIGTVRQRDNIGHDAHLAGGLVGLLVALALRPEVLRTNYLAIAAILVPAGAFFVLLLRRPHLLVLGRFSAASERPAAAERQPVGDLDRLLDKIHYKGFDSLSAREKRQLEELSR